MVVFVFVFLPGFLLHSVPHFHIVILWPAGTILSAQKTSNKRREGVCILSGLYTCVGYLLRSKDCGYYFTYKRCGLSFFPLVVHYTHR